MWSVSARPLEQLTRLYGVQTAYRDMHGRIRAASPDVLLAALRALGCAVKRSADVPDALTERRRVLARRGCEPVVVAWDGRPAALMLHVPREAAEQTAECTLEREDGTRRVWTVSLNNVRAAGRATVDGTRYVSKRLTVPEALPWGYHRLRVELQAAVCETLLLAAPRRAYPASTQAIPRGWGVFLPLYALSTQRNWGSGNLSDLRALVDWVGSLGGQVVGTLPLLASFLDEFFEPSPYAPVSRRFWNEWYVDVSAVPELSHCPEAQTLMASPTWSAELDALRAEPLVDYRRGMACRRRVLEQLAEVVEGGRVPQRREALTQFLQDNPEVEGYARFRAACERHQRPWRQWPAAAREGALVAGPDYDERTVRYHRYVQWVIQEQLQHVADAARACRVRLYLDFPLGVNPDGYDAWRERDIFTAEARTGAPPDPVFVCGQDWGFPPLHPDAVRAQGYRYVIACLRQHLRYAGMLRLDHVMGLHRLFWIPHGCDASRGVYVRYRAEEFYAILSVESHRARAVIVGENLGIVPPEVNRAMAKHHLHHMFVVQYELPTRPRRALRRVAPDAVASLNTHDVSPFNACWNGQDIGERVRLGLLSPAEAQAAHRQREYLRRVLVRTLCHRGQLNGASMQAGAVLRACLALLGTSAAHMVLVNLEDLWGETQPQNIPGTRDEYPNWRHKARHPLEEFSTSPEVLDVLQQMSQWRGQGTPR